ncbi:hypothetical protein MB828_13565 [Streptomyces arenae]|nr:hypothetical protein [Streptomyces arenae]MCG7204837.1 hypothetical protein [Streptomyces arenae]
MAGVAGHDGLAAPIQHDSCPVGRRLSGMCEVGEGTDVMYLDIARGSTDLAGVRQEPSNQLLVWTVHPNRPSIGDFRRPLPLEGYSTEPGHQWLPVLPFDAGLETDAGPARGFDSGLPGTARTRR